MAEKKTKTLSYRGKPLVRSGDTIYLGDMADKYVVKFEILEKDAFSDLNLPTKVSVELMYTDPDIQNRDRVVKTSEKKDLYSAIDIGSIWLERALSE